MTSLRRPFGIALFVGAAAISACSGGKKTTSLACTSYASAEALCSDVNCMTTWAAVETNRAYCDACNSGPRTAGDCGDYHVLTFTGIDSGTSLYYRRDTGALVATQFFGAPSPTSACFAVGATSFTIPACDMATFSMLPSWCSLDAGAGERALPCCSNQLVNCSVDLPALCPASWAQAQAQAPSLCDAQSGGSNAELGSCGAGNVLRYRVYGGTPYAFYYDAGGALIAVVDEAIGRCSYGPMAGVTLPACTPTLASACPGDGAAP